MYIVEHITYYIIYMHIYICGIWLRHAHTHVYISMGTVNLFILAMWYGVHKFLGVLSSCCSEIIIVPGMKWEKYNLPHYTCPTSSADSFCSLDFPLLLTLVAFVEHFTSIACVAPQVYTQRKCHYMEVIYCVLNSCYYYWDFLLWQTVCAY